MKDNVVALDSIRPKTLNRQYKGHKYVLSFLVEERMWKWTVTHVQTTHFSGEPVKDMNKAIRAAERHIDRIMEIGETG